MIPFIAAGAFLVGSAVTAAVTLLVKKNGPAKKIKDLVLLGLPSAGKTTFLKRLKSEMISEDESTTMNEKKTGEFTFKFNGQKILIKNVTDTPGANRYTHEYEKYKNFNGYIYFFFNVNGYLRYLENERITNARLDQIYHVFKDKIDKNEVYIIGTHIDLLRLKTNEINEAINKKVEDKSYRSVLNNLYLTNLLDENSFKNLIEELYTENGK